MMPATGHRWVSHDSTGGRRVVVVTVADPLDRRHSTPVAVVGRAISMGRHSFASIIFHLLFLNNSLFFLLCRRPFRFCTRRTHQLL